MKLTERLNVLIQAITLSQKNGILTLEEAVKAKNAIDTILSGVLNQSYATAINTLIEIIVASQKKGVYTLKDAHMIYLAIEGLDNVFQNEAMNTETLKMEQHQNNTQNNETVITIPPVTLKKNK